MQQVPWRCVDLHFTFHSSHPIVPSGTPPPEVGPTVQCVNSYLTMQLHLSGLQWGDANKFKTKRKRIQIITGTAAATFPTSSSVCIIFLMRACNRNSHHLGYVSDVFKHWKVAQQLKHDIYIPVGTWRCTFSFYWAYFMRLIISLLTLVLRDLKTEPEVAIRCSLLGTFAEFSD